MTPRILIGGLIALVAFPTMGYAQKYKRTYDYRSGNVYNTEQNSDGSTDVRGYNLNTGSSWKTTIESDGDQRGYDSDGNYWKYNNSTGSYTNFGTGEFCTGRGAYRSCSGGN